MSPHFVIYDHKNGAVWAGSRKVYSRPTFLKLKTFAYARRDLGLIGVSVSQLYQNQLTNTHQFPDQVKNMTRSCKIFFIL
jgi:hypothetical protein